MNATFLTFIKNLPPNDQLIYLLIRSYERDLNLSESLDLTLIKEIYEPQIHRLIRGPIQKVHVIKREKVQGEKDPFEEKLGPWASDFSESEIDTLLAEEQ
jgi:hypothetical protein